MTLEHIPEKLQRVSKTSCLPCILPAFAERHGELAVQQNAFVEVGCFLGFQIFLGRLESPTTSARSSKRRMTCLAVMLHSSQAHVLDYEHHSELLSSHCTWEIGKVLNPTHKLDCCHQEVSRSMVVTLKVQVFKHFHHNLVELRQQFGLVR